MTARRPRVLDLTRVMSGPFATQQLADQGADVIKVEPPHGDETRAYQPLHNGASTYFASANRNKRAIVLDLKHPGGARVLKRLLGWADVLVENFRPGVAERLGLAWPTLHAMHPQLVYVAIHAFGDAPTAYRNRPGYDLLIQHLGGHTAMTGFPGTPPTKHPSSIADLTAGLYATQAVLWGLLQREWTGKGQKIVVNMLQAQATLLSYHATRFAITGTRTAPQGNAHASIVPYDVVRCADGWLVVACTRDDVWQRLRGALDLPDREAWRTNAGRVDDRDQLMQALGEALQRRTVIQAEAELTAADVPAGPVLTMDQTLAHPAVERVAIDHQAWGQFEMPGPAFQTTTTPHNFAPPPELGAHTDEILEGLGFSDSERQALRASGGVGR